MTVLRDPEQAETGVIHELINFIGADVLEVGCGDGRLTWRYAERTRSVLALDPDADAVEQARAGLAELPERLRHKVAFQVADITSADLPSEAFDVVVLAWSL
ncbi:MAG TPA: class I SAM-dependent methyltransferase [Ktedonobacterales bacterium]|nr:class I SAM-dependent methyltransferase [Ktedonobacterales bacterium]